MVGQECPGHLALTARRETGEILALKDLVETMDVTAHLERRGRKVIITILYHKGKSKGIY